VNQLLDLLYPPHCPACNAIVATGDGLCGPCYGTTVFTAGLVCDACAVPLIGDAEDAPAHCDACTQAPPVWDRARAPFYYEGTARRMILRLKNGTPDLATPLGLWLAEAAQPLVTPATLVAPVPAHWLRRLARRYDQAALLAAAAARALGLAHHPDLLRRARITPKMDGLTVEARAANVASAFRPDPARLAGAHVLLIDDVMTTGATLDAAARACLDGGAARVSTAFLARVAKRP